MSFFCIVVVCRLCIFCFLIIYKSNYFLAEISYYFCSYEMLADEGSSTSHYVSYSSCDIVLPPSSNRDEVAKPEQNQTEETLLSDGYGTKITPKQSLNNSEMTTFEDCNCGRIKQELLQSRLKVLFTWTTNCQPGQVPFYSLLISVLFSSLVFAMIIFGYEYIFEVWFVFILLLFTFLSLLSLLFISCFNQDQSIFTFKVSIFDIYNWQLCILAKYRFNNNGTKTA